jgi:hypothetical protein
MDPQLYVELDTDLLVAAAREAFGRKYFLSFDPPVTAYPKPPDSWPGMNDEPPEPAPLIGFTWYYVDPYPKLGGGGVFKLDDDMLIFVTTATVELSDGNSWSIDLGTEAKTFEQLSVAGQVAVTPKLPDDV